MKQYIINHKEDCIYDLYGVVNHSGTLNSGHYTAQCYNEPRKSWLNFNDSNVSDIDDLTDLITPRAYVLFYKKRGFDPITLEDYQKLRVEAPKDPSDLIQVGGEVSTSTTQTTAPSVTPTAEVQIVDPLTQAQNADLEDIQQIQMIE